MVPNRIWSQYKDHRLPFVWWIYFQVLKTIKKETNVLNTEILLFGLKCYILRCHYCTVYSIPSPIRGLPFAALHTRGFCSQSFFHKFVNFLGYF